MVVYTSTLIPQDPTFDAMLEVVYFNLCCFAILERAADTASKAKVQYYSGGYHTDILPSISWIYG